MAIEWDQSDEGLARFVRGREPSYAGLARFVRGVEAEDEAFDEQLSLLEDHYVEEESP
jgi:hypothetical protein